MDLSKLRSITNSYLDCHLISLHEWKRAQEIQPRDHGGPYVVIQQGYDPADPYMEPDEFLLGKSGRWLSTSFFFQLPVDVRRQEFVFGTAAEVADVLENLAGKPKILHKGEQLEAPAEPADQDDGLAHAFRQARFTQGPKPPV